MKRTTLTKSLAMLINLSLVSTSFAGLGTPAVPAMPDFAKALTPPNQLGYIESTFKGSTERPVVLIQDLHANYGVQKNIEGLLNFLQPKVAQGNRPMVLGIEAAWGELDLSHIREQEKKVRATAGDILLKNAEITGMDNFVALSEAPVKYVGIDNQEDYLLHRELLRKSLFARLKLARKVEALRSAITVSKSDAPAALKKVWKIEDEFHAGKLDLNQLSKALNVPSIASYGDAEAVLADKKLAVAGEIQGANGFFAKNLVKADQNLDLLSRLLRQQLTFEEVQFASNRVPEMLVAIQGLIPGENLAPWKEAINAAIDYYAVALMRDQPMAHNARALAAANQDTSVVIVTGGFHTAGISQHLREKGISYVIVAPVVQAHTTYDEILYIKRMMGNHMTAPEIAKAVKSAPTVQAINIASSYLGLGGARTPNAGPRDPGTEFHSGFPVVTAIFEAVASKLKARADLRRLKKLAKKMVETPTKAELEQSQAIDASMAPVNVGKPAGGLKRLLNKARDLVSLRRHDPLAETVKVEATASVDAAATKPALPSSVTVESVAATVKNVNITGEVGTKRLANVTAGISSTLKGLMPNLSLPSFKRQNAEVEKQRGRIRAAFRMAA
jgi:hypothetical protein